MDGWLKTLIATACVVIIAGGGYYAWGEWKNAQLRTAIADRAKASRLTGEYCNKIAMMTIPDKVGQPVKTDAHLRDLNECDNRGLLNAYERHQLDMMGVF